MSFSSYIFSRMRLPCHDLLAGVELAVAFGGSATTTMSLFSVAAMMGRRSNVAPCSVCG